MDIYSILASKPHNPYYLNRYVTFVQRNVDKYPENQSHTEKHHICPKAKDMFPAYKDFNLHEWNKIILPLKKHFYAHYLLSKIFYWSITQNESFCLMGGRLKNKNLLFLINEYHKGVEKRGKVQSARMRGMVSAIEVDTGKKILVSKHDFEEDENLVGVTKGLFVGNKNSSKREEVRKKISIKKTGLVNVFDKKQNKIVQINSKDFDVNLHEIKTGFSGRTNYIIKTRTRKIKSITFDDPLYKTNEYVSNNAKYIIKIKIDSNEFYLNNEYARNLFEDEMKVNIRCTNRLPDLYKLHKSGKFMIKRETVESFFMNL